MIDFENIKALLRDQFRKKERTKSRNGFSDRKCHFKLVILGSVDAVCTLQIYFAKTVNVKDLLLLIFEYSPRSRMQSVT